MKYCTDNDRLRSFYFSQKFLRLKKVNDKICTSGISEKIFQTQTRTRTLNLNTSLPKPYPKPVRVRARVWVMVGPDDFYRALSLFDDIDLDFHDIITQIPNFLPLTSPWPDLDDYTKNQYIIWLNAFCDYMKQRSEEFFHHLVNITTKSVTKNLKHFF